MKARDFRNVLLFMCNRWSQEECCNIFNGYNFGTRDWKYSLGEHIWNKWCEACEYHHGSLDCIASFLLEGIDNNCLQKLIDRAEEYYNK